MKSILTMTGALVLTLAGTGCATKKYVTQRLSPVEAHVSAVETKNDSKNAEQDTKLAAQGKEIEDLGTDLSRSKERLAADIATADQKAVAPGRAPRRPASGPMPRSSPPTGPRRWPSRASSGPPRSNARLKV